LANKQCAHISARIAVVRNGTARTLNATNEKKKCEKKKNKMIFFVWPRNNNGGERTRNDDWRHRTNKSAHMRFVGGVARTRSART
jgi:hypothetical protein